MPKQSAGLLLYRRSAPGLEVFLAHPGGPLWAGKDDGAWSIPKGEFTEEETPMAAARREFLEETGFLPEGRFVPLAPLRQPSGKMVYAWAVEGDADPEAVHSNTFLLEWPRGSGRMLLVPEIDRAAWYALDAAIRKIMPGQLGFLHQLARMLEDPPGC